MRNMISSESEPRLPERSTTDIVQNLFGMVVGPCWADDSCSYNRHHGRLYVSTKALCFYSNLFGFERRLCLFLEDVDILELYRSTSIRICMVDGEDFVFKSLSDRNSILKTLSELKNHQTPSQLSRTQLADISDDIPSQSGALEMDIYLSLQTTETSSQPPLRRRTKSAPGDISVRIPKDSGGGSSQELDALIRSRTASSGASSSVASQENAQDAWGEYKQADDPPYGETVLKGIKLCCSLSVFYDTLIADDAPWSIPRFQKEIVGDSEIEVSSWALDETGDQDMMHRTITFRHPIKGNLGIGPSAAMTRREQRLRHFGTYGMSLETSSFVKGVPASDCFYVDDRWLVEQHTGCVLLTVQYQTRFTSGTLLKRLIGQSVKTEVNDWYRCYAKLLTKVFKIKWDNNEKKVEKRCIEDKPTIQTCSSLHTTRRQGQKQLASLNVTAYFLFFGMAVFIQAWYFQRQILLLQQEVRQLRKDQVQSSDQLLSISREDKKMRD